VLYDPSYTRRAKAAWSGRKALVHGARRMLGRG
jgi:hypothetical protein